MGADLPPDSRGGWQHSLSHGASVSVEHWFDMILNPFVDDLNEVVLILCMAKKKCF